MGGGRGVAPGAPPRDATNPAPRLKPAALHDAALAALDQLTQLATLNLAALEGPIFAYGTAPLKVYFLMVQQGGPVYTPELVRMGEIAGVSRRMVFDAVTQLEADGFITRDGSEVRVCARNRTNS